MIFQSGADDLLAVIEVFRSDETDHGIAQQRLEVASYPVGSGLAGLLIQSVVGIGREATALASLEIHDVVAKGAAPQAEGGVICLLQ